VPRRSDAEANRMRISRTRHINHIRFCKQNGGEFQVLNRVPSM
jgi:hypothetical protein